MLAGVHVHSHGPPAGLTLACCCINTRCVRWWHSGEATDDEAEAAAEEDELPLGCI